MTLVGSRGTRSRRARRTPVGSPRPGSRKSAANRAPPRSPKRLEPSVCQLIAWRSSQSSTPSSRRATAAAGPCQAPGGSSPGLRGRNRDHPDFGSARSAVAVARPSVAPAASFRTSRSSAGEAPRSASCSSPAACHLLSSASPTPICRAQPPRRFATRRMWARRRLPATCQEGSVPAAAAATTGCASGGTRSSPSMAEGNGTNRSATASAR